jgi:hypothetical protein
VHKTAHVLNTYMQLSEDVLSFLIMFDFDGPIPDELILIIQIAFIIPMTFYS